MDSSSTKIAVILGPTSGPSEIIAVSAATTVTEESTTSGAKRSSIIPISSQR